MGLAEAGRRSCPPLAFARRALLQQRAQAGSANSSPATRSCSSSSSSLFVLALFVAERVLLLLSLLFWGGEGLVSSVRVAQSLNSRNTTSDNAP